MRPRLPKHTNGLSVYVAIGAWAPPRVQLTKFSGHARGLRMCLGFVSIHLMPRDIEALLGVAAHVCSSEGG